MTISLTQMALTERAKNLRLFREAADLGDRISFNSVPFSLTRLQKHDRPSTPDEPP